MAELLDQANEQKNDMVSKGQDLYSRLTRIQKVIIGISVVSVIAILLYVIIGTRSVQMQTPYTDLENEDSGKITEYLEANDIDYELSNDGTLATPYTIEIPAANLNQALQATEQRFDADTPKNVTITLGDPDNIVSSSITNFSGITDISPRTQDGYQSGNLVGLFVGPTGLIQGQFSNNQVEVLGQVVIAKFTNDEGLIAAGGNMFDETPNSGVPNFGTAGENFPSTTVRGQNLEQSNVDLTQEFTDMISTQRAFEAASRTITVSDQMLGETNQLKR